MPDSIVIVMNREQGERLKSYGARVAWLQPSESTTPDRAEVTLKGDLFLWRGNAKRGPSLYHAVMRLVVMQLKMVKYRQFGADNRPSIYTVTGMVTKPKALPREHELRQ